MANVLNTDNKIAVIAALAEGSSIRSIERITGIHRDTIMRLGVKVGKGCTNHDGSEDAEPPLPAFGTGRDLGIRRQESQAPLPKATKKMELATFGHGARLTLKPN